MPDDLAIRPAGTGDCDALAQLHAACFDAPWTAAELARWLAMPAALAPAAFAEDKAAGFILALVAAGEAEILTFAVHPDRRRMGIGQALLRALESEARKRDAQTLYLDVAEDNTAALAFYRNAGFAEATRRRGYYVRHAGMKDAIVMTKALRND